MLINFHVPVPVYAQTAGISYSAARNLMADVTAIRIPSQIGEVQEFYRGSQDKLIVLIQDAHSIPDAQNSIRGLLSFFQGQYGIDLTLIEGSADTYDPQIFRSYPDEKQLKQTFKQYLTQAELTGTTAAAIFNDDEGIYEGIEDWHLYEKGVEFYLDALSIEPEASAQLKEFVETLSEVKKRTYSEDLLYADRMVGDFREDHIDLLKLLQVLSRYHAPPSGSKLEALVKSLDKADAGTAIDLTVEVKSIARRIEAAFKSMAVSAGSLADFERFNLEKQRYGISEISAEQYGLFLYKLIRKYRLPIRVSNKLGEKVGQQKRIQDIRGTQLFRDLEAYIRNTKKTLFRNAEETRLDQESTRLDILERLIRLELTQEDWQSLKQFWTEYRQDTVAADGVITGFEIKELLDKLRPHVTFYEVAHERDLIFMKKALENMKKHRRDQAILVAGGFHTEGLTQQFEQEGVSYLLIRPEIKSMPDEHLYREHMQGKVSWSDYFEVRNGKVNLYEAFVRGTRDFLLKQSSAERGRILKNWRDQIIRDLAAKGEIERAGEYVRFIDELNQNKDTALSELQRQWMDAIDAFIDGVEALNSNGRLTPNNVLGLMGYSTTAEPVLLGLARNELRVGLLPGIAVRSEVRSEDSSEPQVQAQASEISDVNSVLAALETADIESQNMSELLNNALALSAPGQAVADVSDGPFNQLIGQAFNTQVSFANRLSMIQTLINLAAFHIDVLTTKQQNETYWALEDFFNQHSNDIEDLRRINPAHSYFLNSSSLDTAYDNINQAKQAAQMVESIPVQAPAAPSAEAMAALKTVDQLNAEIEALESSISDMGLSRIPLFGLNGIPFGAEMQPDKDIWYFLFDSSNSKYWTDAKLQRIESLDALRERYPYLVDRKDLIKAGLTDGTLSASDVMDMSEFFERVQGSILRNKQYGNFYDINANRPPSMRLLINVDDHVYREGIGDTQNTLDLPNSDQSENYRALYQENIITMNEIGSENILSFDMDGEYDALLFRAISEHPDNAYQQTRAVHYYVSRRLYQMALEKIIEAGNRSEQRGQRQEQEHLGELPDHLRRIEIDPENVETFYVFAQAALKEVQEAIELIEDRTDKDAVKNNFLTTYTDALRQKQHPIAVHKAFSDLLQQIRGSLRSTAPSIRTVRGEIGHIGRAMSRHAKIFPRSEMRSSDEAQPDERAREILLDYQQKLKTFKGFTDTERDEIERVFDAVLNNDDNLGRITAADLNFAIKSLYQARQVNQETGRTLKYPITFANITAVSQFLHDFTGLRERVTNGVPAMLKTILNEGTPIELSAEGLNAYYKIASIDTGYDEFLRYLAATGRALDQIETVYAVQARVSQNLGSLVQGGFRERQSQVSQALKSIKKIESLGEAGTRVTVQPEEGVEIAFDLNLAPEKVSVGWEKIDLLKASGAISSMNSRTVEFFLTQRGKFIDGGLAPLIAYLAENKGNLDEHLADMSRIAATANNAQTVNNVIAVTLLAAGKTQESLTSEQAGYLAQAMLTNAPDFNIEGGFFLQILDRIGPNKTGSYLAFLSPFFKTENINAIDRLIGQPIRDGAGLSSAWLSNVLLRVQPLLTEDDRAAIQNEYAAATKAGKAMIISLFSDNAAFLRNVLETEIDMHLRVHALLYYSQTGEEGRQYLKSNLPEYMQAADLKPQMFENTTIAKISQSLGIPVNVLIKTYGLGVLAFNSELTNLSQAQIELIATEVLSNAKVYVIVDEDFDYADSSYQLSTSYVKNSSAHFTLQILGHESGHNSLDLQGVGLPSVDEYNSFSHSFHELISDIISFAFVEKTGATYDEWKEFAAGEKEGHEHVGDWADPLEGHVLSRKVSIDLPGLLQEKGVSAVAYAEAVFSKVNQISDDLGLGRIESAQQLEDYHSEDFEAQAVQRDQELYRYLEREAGLEPISGPLTVDGESEHRQRILKKFLEKIMTEVLASEEGQRSEYRSVAIENFDDLSRFLKSERMQTTRHILQSYYSSGLLPGQEYLDDFNKAIEFIHGLGSGALMRQLRDNPDVVQSVLDALELDVKVSGSRRSVAAIISLAKSEELTVQSRAYEALLRIKETFNDLLANPVNKNNNKPLYTADKKIEMIAANFQVDQAFIALEQTAAELAQDLTKPHDFILYIAALRLLSMHSQDVRNAYDRKLSALLRGRSITEGINAYDRFLALGGLDAVGFPGADELFKAAKFLHAKLPSGSGGIINRAIKSEALSDYRLRASLTHSLVELYRPRNIYDNQQFHDFYLKAPGLIEFTLRDSMSHSERMDYAGMFREFMNVEKTTDLIKNEQFSLLAKLPDEVIFLVIDMLEPPFYNDGYSNFNKRFTRKILMSEEFSDAVRLYAFGRYAQKEVVLTKEPLEVAVKIAIHKLKSKSLKAGQEIIEGFSGAYDLKINNIAVLLWARQADIEVLNSDRAVKDYIDATMNSRLLYDYNNANSNMEFGVVILKRFSGESFMMIAAHEYMHRILVNQFTYYFGEGDQDGVHEFLADLLAFKLAADMGWDVNDYIQNLNFGSTQEKIANNFYISREEHDTGRSQFMELYDALGSETLSTKRLMDAALDVMTKHPQKERIRSDFGLFIEMTFRRYLDNTSFTQNMRWPSQYATDEKGAVRIVSADELKRIKTEIQGKRSEHRNASSAEIAEILEGELGRMTGDLVLNGIDAFAISGSEIRYKALVESNRLNIDMGSIIQPEHVANIRGLFLSELQALEQPGVLGVYLSLQGRVDAGTASQYDKALYLVIQSLLPEYVRDDANNRFLKAESDDVDALESKLYVLAQGIVDDVFDYLKINEGLRVDDVEAQKDACKLCPHSTGIATNFLRKAVLDDFGSRARVNVMLADVGELNPDTGKIKANGAQHLWTEIEIDLENGRTRRFYFSLVDSQFDFGFEKGVFDETKGKVNVFSFETDEERDAILRERGIFLLNIKDNNDYYQTNFRSLISLYKNFADLLRQNVHGDEAIAFEDNESLDESARNQMAYFTFFNMMGAANNLVKLRRDKESQGGETDMAKLRRYEESQRAAIFALNNAANYFQRYGKDHQIQVDFSEAEFVIIRAAMAQVKVRKDDPDAVPIVSLKQVISILESFNRTSDRASIGMPLRMLQQLQKNKNAEQQIDELLAVLAEAELKVEAFVKNAEAITPLIEFIGGNRDRLNLVLYNLISGGSEATDYEEALLALVEGLKEGPLGRVVTQEVVQRLQGQQRSRVRQEIAQQRRVEDQGDRSEFRSAASLEQNDALAFAQLVASPDIRGQLNQLIDFGKQIQPQLAAQQSIEWAKQGELNQVRQRMKEAALTALLAQLDVSGNRAIITSQADLDAYRQNAQALMATLSVLGDRSYTLGLSLPDGLDVARSPLIEELLKIMRAGEGNVSEIVFEGQLPVGVQNDFTDLDAIVRSHPFNSSRGLITYNDQPAVPVLTLDAASSFNPMFIPFGANLEGVEDQFVQTYVEMLRSVAAIHTADLISRDKDRTLLLNPDRLKEALLSRLQRFGDSYENILTRQGDGWVVMGSVARAQLEMEIARITAASA